MAEETDDSQKTEEPTQKRLDEARAKGEVPKAPEMKHVAMLGGGLFVITSLAGGVGASLYPTMVNILGNAEAYPLAPEGANDLAQDILFATGRALLIPLALLLAAAIVGGLAQGRPTLSWSRLQPKFSKISPLAGIKRLFSMPTMVEFLKTLAKFAILATVATSVVWPYSRRLETVLQGTLSDSLSLATGLVIKMLLTVAVIVTIMAIVDFIYQRQSFLKRMRMSKQELKDEYKQSEGDPHVKARLRQIRMERSRKRMMAQVPTADVVITNPTHFAVALKYEHGVMAAPKVVAKGVDSLALRIRTLAEESKVPIVENPPLARALYATVELDEEVKPEQYKAVAEVISYVMKLRGRRIQAPQSHP